MAVNVRVTLTRPFPSLEPNDYAHNQQCREGGWLVVLLLHQMAILELLVQITDNEQMVIPLHANVATRFVVRQ